MTQATSLLGGGNNFNFISVARSTQNNVGILEVVAPENGLIDKLNGTGIVNVISLDTIQAGRIFGSDRFIIKFKLADEFATSFTLLRAFFDFNRTRAISISSNSKDQVFEVVIFETQSSNLTAYLEKQFEWLIKEIKFRNSLRIAINFEKSIKREGDRLYADLRTAVL